MMLVFEFSNIISILFQASALLRTTTTYLWLFYYTLFLASIMVMFYFYPDFSFSITELVSTDWSELPLLKQKNTVNMLLASTISLGWSSLLLDLLLARLKYSCQNFKTKSEANRNYKGREKQSFWDETVLLQGHKYWQTFTIFPFIFVMALALIIIFNAGFYLIQNLFLV